MSMPHTGSSWVAEIVSVNKRCRFKACAVANKGAVDFWLWVCDSSTTGATSPTCCPLKVPAGTTQSLDWTEAPRDMAQGIYCAATTDPQVKTLIAANDAFFEVAYENL